MNKHPLFIPNQPIPCVGYECEINREAKLAIAKEEIMKYPDASILHNPNSTDIVLTAIWYKENEYSSSLYYDFCIAPNKPMRSLDDLDGIRIIHYHDGHKAFDMNYELCSPPGSNSCITRFHNKAIRCITGSIDHLPVRYEPLDEDTYMEIHLTQKVNNKLQRTNRKQAHDERTMYIIEQTQIKYDDPVDISNNAYNNYI